ncbi:unnamed protein product [Lactuca saligna]|uniref:Uncharacterized protein n=1 Tax=Lactuca saligna TaxID=75948 RepID=A0AA35YFN4_LACSI|nr:unnamed protein product [Lactuca saligna]
MNTSIQSPSNQDLMQRPMDFAGEHHHAIRTAGSGTMTEAAQSTRNVDLSPEAPCSDPIRLSTSATSNCEQPSLLGMSRIRQHSDRYFIFRILLSIDMVWICEYKFLRSHSYCSGLLYHHWSVVIYRDQMMDLPILIKNGSLIQKPYDIRNKVKTVICTSHM